MAKSILGKIITYSTEESRKMHEESHKRLFEGKGQFSGTNECECGGKVIYSTKRNDGAELGCCQKCGKPYTDFKGNRLPSVYDNNIRINSCSTNQQICSTSYLTQ